MATVEIEQQWIDKFQDNLGIIRKVAGWTTQKFADEIGVARQTVSNLETGKTPMTKLQYLALRTVFNAEIARCNNLDLAKVIKTLVDDPIGYDVEIPETVVNDLAQHSMQGCRIPISQDNANVGNTGTGNLRNNTEARRPLSAAMQALAVITGVLVSGTVAGALAYLLFPEGDSKK